MLLSIYASSAAQIFLSDKDPITFIDLDFELICSRLVLDYCPFKVIVADILVIGNAGIARNELLSLSLL